MKRALALLAGLVLFIVGVLFGIFRYNDAKARQEFNEQRAKECRLKEEAAQDVLKTEQNQDRKAQLSRDLEKARQQCADEL